MIDLKSIQKNKSKPPRFIIHGESGLGKTTLGSKFPDPVFIQTEDGLGVIDVPAFPLAESYEDVMQALTALATDEHQFKTLVVDSIDWFEPLVWKATCQRLGVSSIEQPGYGKGYVETSFEWRNFVKALTYLRDEKGMIILMIAHSQVVHIDDPTLAPYDSFSLKLHKRAAGILEEFADIIGFAAIKTMTKTEKTGFNEERNRAITTGERVLHLEVSPAFVSKNRYGVGETIPLTWEAIEQNISNGV
jgi:hypothetical protein